MKKYDYVPHITARLRINLIHASIQIKTCTQELFRLDVSEKVEELLISYKNTLAVTNGFMIKYGVVFQENKLEFFGVLVSCKSCCEN